MVQNNRIDSQLCSFGDFIVVGDPAVDGDQQTATFRRTTLYNIRGQSVVILSNRYLPARLGSQMLEHFPQ